MRLAWTIGLAVVIGFRNSASLMANEPEGGEGRQVGRGPGLSICLLFCIFCATINLSFITFNNSRPVSVQSCVGVMVLGVWCQKLQVKITFFYNRAVKHEARGPESVRQKLQSDPLNRRLENVKKDVNSKIFTMFLSFTYFPLPPWLVVLHHTKLNK